MSTARPDAGSFRDRSGRVYLDGDRVYRTVMRSVASEFDFVRGTSLIDELVRDGKLIAEHVVEGNPLGAAGEGAAYILEHPRLPFISYPYEWPFAALKAAALTQLDIHLAALEKGVTLSDATAYNIQFNGAAPIFIDALSFRRYVDGEFWVGHRQFCDQFLNPLLLRALLGVPHNAWYRGALEGIGAGELNALLPLRRKLSWNVFTQVVLQAKLQAGAQRDDKALDRARSRQLPLIGFQQMLHGLRKWIARLEPRGGDTVWADYADDHSYQDDEAEAKRRFVAGYVRETSPGMLWDLGCNTGDYSVVALEAGADFVVGFDFDQDAIEAAFHRSAAQGLAFLPLLFDAVNPSPGQGWRQAERQGLEERASADGIIALALIHHLAIAKNIPLEAVIDWLVGLAPSGIIEFVQKSDPMVERLLALREDIFDDYDQESFERHLAARARIVRSERVSVAGRYLYEYRRG